MAGCNGNDVDDFLYMVLRSMESRDLRVNVFPNTLQGTLHGSRDCGMWPSEVLFLGF